MTSPVAYKKLENEISNFNLQRLAEKRGEAVERAWNAVKWNLADCASMAAVIGTYFLKREAVVLVAAPIFFVYLCVHTRMAVSAKAKSEELNQQFIAHSRGPDLV